jgi:hypothetical protein
MKLSGKKLKEFFSSPKGVFIDRGDKLVFIDLEHDKTNVILKPRDEANIDELPKIIYSRVFDAVNALDDNTEYSVDVVFNTIMFTTMTKEGKIMTELVISGDRY